MGFPEVIASASQALANTLGLEVQYLPAEGDAVSFRAAFKSTMDVVDGETGAPVDLRSPRILVRHDAIGKTPELEDRFTLRGKTYFAHSVEEDSHGSSIVHLRLEQGQ